MRKYISQVLGTWGIFIIIIREDKIKKLYKNKRHTTMKKIIYLIMFFAILTSSYSQWELLKGPGNNVRVGNLFVNENEIYITAVNTIFKSTDIGKTWNQLNDRTDLIFAGISKICKFKGCLFLFSQGRNGDPNFGISTSTDDGANWLLNNEGISKSTFMDITIADGDIYSIFDYMIYKYDFNEKKWIKS